VAHADARRQERPHDVALLLAVARSGVLLVAVGAVLVLVFGLWLVDLGGHSLAEAWLVAAVLLFALAVALGAAGGRRPRQARVLAARLAACGEEPTPELRRLIDDRASAVANYIAVLAVAVILALMVWKPGAG
jgi:uncharacterized membrane protein